MMKEWAKEFREMTTEEILQTIEVAIWELQRQKTISNEDLKALLKFNIKGLVSLL